MIQSVEPQTESAFVDELAKGDRDYRYVPVTGQWIRWDHYDGVWKRECDTGAIEYRVRKAVESTLPSDGLGKRLRTQAGITAIVRMAQAHPSFRIDLDLLDTNAYEINTHDGVVDLTNGNLRNREKWGYHTKITGCGFATGFQFGGAADCPQWKAFLHTTFEGNAELIEYLRKLLGCALIGKVSAHILPFLHGGGDNGKSVLLETVAKVLGDYAITAPANFLLAGHSEHATEIARLQGARFVLCSEVNQGDRFDEARIKLLTGGDRLTGRFMRKDYTDFQPTHTLFLMGNHQPSVGAGGHAFWRRLKLIPFTHQMPAAEQVEGLAEKLFDLEGGRILAWMVSGAVDVIRGGLGEPPVCVSAATAEYAQSEDTIAQFVAECCTRSEVCNPLTRDVWTRYDMWCREGGLKSKPLNAFSQELKKVRLDGKLIDVRKATGNKSHVFGVLLDKMPHASLDQDAANGYQKDD
jgi:P4 family phage/plasmid primase-like protien